MSHYPGQLSRRNWDTEAFAKRAREREQAERDSESERLQARKGSENRDHVDGDPFGPTRAWLRKRDHEIDLESKVGSTEVVSSIRSGGFRCNICDVTMKDSNRFLYHVNSRLHQKKLGMSMRVKRSTAAEVRDAFLQVLREKEAKQAEGGKHYTHKGGIRRGESRKQKSSAGDKEHGKGQDRPV